MSKTRNRALFLILTLFIIVTSQSLYAERKLINAETNASWYGEEFNGRPTSSGEIFNMNALTAAHKTLPFGTMLEVTNLSNGKKVIVRINDRGPFVESRELDVSKAAAQMLDIISTGIARVSIYQIDGLDAAAVSADAVQSSSPTLSSVSALSSEVSQSNQNDSGTRWRIQLASFTSIDNATRFVGELRKAGFEPAFEKTPQTTRVVIAGLSSENLAQIKERLSTAGYRDLLIRKESR